MKVQAILRHAAQDQQEAARRRPTKFRALLKLLSAEITLELLLRLAKSERDVGSLTQELCLDMATVSRALKEMRQYLLVDVERVKQRHIYRLGSGVEVQFNGDAVVVTSSTDDGGVITVIVPRQVI